jgi:bacterioferritin (cytochrome b1)
VNDIGLLAAVRQAMLNERAGADFYMMAARATVDPKGRETFLILAAEEALHLRYLKEQYNLIAAGKNPEPLISASHGAELGEPSPIFSEHLRDRISDAHIEMSALAVGLKLEHESIALYRSLAASTEMPEARHFFEKLVAWEQNHASALARQQAQLLESYWQAAGFAPF